MARRPGVGDMRAFARDTGGAIAVMTALVLPVLIGVAAYAIDASLLLYRQERLQVAADIGARAGADLLRRGESEADAAAIAEALVAANAGVATGPSLAVTATFPEPGGRVRVDAELKVERIFSQIFGSQPIVVHAAGTAAVVPQDDPVTCVYLDGDDADAGLALGNGSRMTVAGCEVVARNNVRLADGARLAADCVTAGGRFEGPLPDVTCTDGPFENASPLPPPPASPDAPQPTSTDCADVPRKTAVQLRPMAIGIGPAQLYFCDGLTIARDTTVRGDAGIYFVSGGDLVIEDRATLELGRGAVIVLLDAATVTMAGGSRLTLAAPETGPFTGVAILAGDRVERAKQAPLSHALSALDVDGLISLPGETIVIGASNAERCIRIVAGTLDLSRGGIRFDSSCPTGE